MLDLEANGPRPRVGKLFAPPDHLMLLFPPTKRLLTYTKRCSGMETATMFAHTTAAPRNVIRPEWMCPTSQSVRSCMTRLPPFTRRRGGPRMTRLVD